jgi:hypothetical protein
MKKNEVIRKENFDIASKIINFEVLIKIILSGGIKNGKERNPNNYNSRVHGSQKRRQACFTLHDYEEQAEYARAHGIEEIQSLPSQAYYS